VQSWEDGNKERKERKGKDKASDGVDHADMAWSELRKRLVPVRHSWATGYGEIIGAGGCRETGVFGD